MYKAFKVISNKTMSSMRKRVSCDANLFQESRSTAAKNVYLKSSLPRCVTSLTHNYLTSQISSSSSVKQHDNSQSFIEMLLGSNHIKHEYYLVSSLPILSSLICSHPLWKEEEQRTPTELLPWMEFTKHAWVV